VDDLGGDHDQEEEDEGCMAAIGTVDSTVVDVGTVHVIVVVNEGIVDVVIVVDVGDCGE